MGLRGALLEAAAGASAPELAGWNDSPAEAALAPLLCAAGGLLDEALASAGVPVLPPVRRDLVGILARRLTWTCLPLLAHERAAVEATAPPGAPCALDASVPGWKERFRVYPALGTLVERAVLGWRAHVGELLGRLRQDWELLGGPAALAGVRGDAGDLHAGGRAVAVLRFEGGRGAVYKPKDLRVTRAVLELCDFLGSAGLPLPLHVRWVLPRGEYTWEELVEAAPCRTRAEVERFYFRVGELLRLFQLLEARDLSCDNLLAAGEHPVFVDLEMVLQPRRSGGRGEAERQLLESVAPIGILAAPAPVAPGLPAEDFGALAPPHELLSPLRWGPALEALAGPRRRSRHGYLSWPPPEHAPVLGGEPARAVELLEPMLEGYRAMHDVLRANRARLLAPGGPLERMAGLPVRYLHRDTWTYYRLAQAALSPRLLASEERHDAALAGLGLLEAEVEALRAQDVPYFLCATDGGALLGPGGRALEEGFFEGTGIDRARGRVEALEAFPLERHEDAVRSTLGTGRHQLPARPGEGEEVGEDGPVEWLAQAVELGDFILAEAIGEGGALAWLGLTYDPVHDLWQLDVLRPDILTGSAGIAIVLAELYAASAQERFRRAAWAALGATRAAARRAPEPRGAVGAFVGVGAHLYALHRCAAALGDSELAVEARARGEALPLDALGREAPLDVVTGLAGLVLALIACEAEAPARALATALERRLSAAAPTSRPSPRGLPDSALERGLPAGAPASQVSQRTLPSSALGTTALERGVPAGAPASRPSPRDLPDSAPERGASGAPAFRPSLRDLPGLEEGLALCAARLEPGWSPPADRSGAEAERLGRRALARRRRSGRWFPDRLSADRHELSALWGVPALAHLFLRIHQPARWPSLRTVMPVRF